MAILYKILSALALGFVLFGILIFIFQSRLIYFPQKYPRKFLESVSKKLIRIKYNYDSKEYLGYYSAPEDGQMPDKIWVFFVGNGSLALGMLSFIEELDHKSTGYLMYEYPGYGENKGKPNPRLILETSKNFLSAAAKYLEMDQESLLNQSGFLGHSLGSAAALQLAVEKTPQKLILLSPFTTMQDMACRTVGKPLCFLLRHNISNTSNLDKLVKLESKPEIVIFHGGRDEIIPVKMGRRLKELFPDNIDYTEIPNSDHNRILSVGFDKIRDSMGSL